MSRMISPNELQEEAKKAMLEGKEPQTITDWRLCVSYWAANLAIGLEESACALLGKIFDCPLSEKDIREIAKYQQVRK